MSDGLLALTARPVHALVRALERSPFLRSDEDRLAPSLAFLNRAGRNRRGVHEMNEAEARAELRMLTRLGAAPLPAHVEIVSRTIHTAEADLPARIYRPRGARGPLPGVVFFHGGGFVVGDLDTHQSPCAHLAADAEAVVVSVDYRLAPEHPFPAATHDASSAYRWVREQAPALEIDAARLAVGGDSAGGNLAAVVAQEFAGRDDAPVAQILNYPWLEAEPTHLSRHRFAVGYGLEEWTLQWFVERYAPRGLRDDPRVSPLRGPVHAALPPAFVATAGFDPLADEGIAYARRLSKAGVPVVARHYPSLMHGYLQMNFCHAAREARRELGRDVHALLRR